MDPVLNPYTPNAGARPQAVVGRDDQLRLFDLYVLPITRRTWERQLTLQAARVSA